MQPPTLSGTGIGRWILPALLGVLAGTALQLQQAALSGPLFYACLLLVALVLYALVAIE